MRESPESIHARKAELIAGIAAGKTVIEAAAQSGIGWRRAYVWRAEDAVFRAAWDQARAQIKARIPAELAVPSSPEPPPAQPPFVIPPSPPLPPAPWPRWRGQPPKPRVTVVIQPLEDDDVLNAREAAAKAAAAQTDDKGVY